MRSGLTVSMMIRPRCAAIITRVPAVTSAASVTDTVRRTARLLPRALTNPATTRFVMCQSRTNDRHNPVNGDQNISQPSRYPSTNSCLSPFMAILAECCFKPTLRCVDGFRGEYGNYRDKDYREKTHTGKLQRLTPPLAMASKVP